MRPTLCISHIQTHLLLLQGPILQKFDPAVAAFHLNDPVLQKKMHATVTLEADFFSTS